MVVGVVGGRGPREGRTLRRLCRSAGAGLWLAGRASCGRAVDVASLSS